MSDRCEFCESLQSYRNIREFLDKERKQEHQEKIYEEYKVALVIRSWAKGKKSTAGRVTDYRYRGCGYNLNYCPECGAKMEVK